MSQSESNELLIARLLDLPAAERAAYWQRVCAENPGLDDRLPVITQLLAGDADAAAGSPSSPPSAEAMVHVLKSALSPADQEAPGTRIGHYKLLQKIGEGGFGAVWMAEQQEPLRRRVALKIIKIGLDTEEVIARFEAERQALALMDHPNIARVFDAGATAAGRPFFVMELVRGVAITRYCDDNRLTTEARLRLFIPVCQAVQHAHQKGIIHRDIKPSNILVTLHDGTPVPKVIDFGIAKATDKQLTEKTLVTHFHAFVGTPAYTSPEQMEMSGLDVDTRSDIYSLGVLLYELLAGRPPFDPAALVKSGLEAMRRTIREVDPPRPSHQLGTLSEADRISVAHRRSTEGAKLAFLLRGDVDWIVMHCLEKDRTRRYDTAAAMAMDIQHHLQSEPVAARPPSQLYRLGKFARRHRVGVAASAAIALSLVGGLIATATLFVREHAARQRAVVAEQSESRLRLQAESARQLETKRVARTALTLAEQLFPQGRTAEGLAYLVQAARKDPQNPTIAPRLASILATRNFFQQEGAPLQLGSRVLLGDFSPDGQRLRILCEDGTLAAVNLASGEVRRSKSPAPPTSAQWVGVTEKEGALLCVDGVVRVFDWDTMQPVREIRLEKKGMWARPAENKRGLMLIRLEDQSWTLVDLTTGRTQPVPWITPTTDHEFTSDGRWLTANLNYGIGRELHLFDGLTGEKRTTLSFGGPLYAHFISPDGNREVTVAATDARGNGPMEVRIWSLPELEPLTEPQFVEDSVGESGTFRLTFSPDKSRFLVSTPNGSQVYDLATGTKVGVYVSGAAGSRSVPSRQLPDGRRIASLVSGGARIWDNTTGRPVTPPMLHNGEIHSMKCSENGEVLLTTCSDGFARLWDTTTGRLLAEPILEQSVGMVASLSPDGRRLVIGTAGGEVYRLRVGRGVARPVALPRIAGVGPATVRPDDLARMLWLQRDRVIWIRRDRATLIDASSTRGIAGEITFPEPIGSLEGLRETIGIRSDPRFIVVGTASGKWQTWELGAAGITRIITLEDGPSGMGGMGFSPGGDRVAFIADDDLKRVRFWDLLTGKPVGPPCVSYSSISTTRATGAFSPDGLRFVTGNRAGVATVWDVATGQALLQLELRRGVWIQCVNCNPDGTRIVAANNRGEAQLWDAVSGRPAGAVFHHSGEIRSAVFSGDGRYLLTSSADRTARVWDGHDGAPVGEPMVHDGIIRSAQFSADGSRVVTASNDGTARVWDVRTGQPLTAPMMHPNRVGLATFSPDGHFVSTVSAATPDSPSTYWLWSVPPDAGSGPAPEWLLNLATIRAAKTVDEAGRCVEVPEVVGQLDGIRRQLAALPQDAPFAEWGRWMLDDRVDRSIAPGFTLTAGEADQLAKAVAAPATAR